MQVKKENIRQIILIIAKEQFLKKGYKSVSMRTIASLANMPVSNIYNYFKNKDELLGAVLTPLLETFDRCMDEHNKDEKLTLDVFVSKSYQREMIQLFLDLIVNYKQELNLLLFHSAGSSYENFRDCFTNKQTKMGMDYIENMQKRYSYINTTISRFFIHTMSAWWLAIIGEVITHEELTTEDIELFLSEYVAFATAGWKELMKV